MRKNFPAGLLLISIAAVGCHARIPVIGSPPPYDLAHEASDGKFNSRIDASVNEDDNHYMQAFRFEIPAPGSISATAKPVNPQAQISVNIYASGSGNDPIAKGEPGKKVEATELQPGTYYVAVTEPWATAVRSKVDLRVIFKPADPDANQTACKTQATARDLSPSGQVEDQVDYSAARRTCFWHIALGGDGALQVKFNNQGNNISADFVPAQGAPEKIDPVAGLNKTDLPAGDYYVKVYANDAGDSGKYSLATTFKQGDTCKNGGPACDISGAEDLKLPSDSKTGDVDYSKSKQFHFYKASLKEKGKLTLNFKIVSPPRASKVAAYFMRNPDDEGEKIVGASVTKDIDQPGDYFIRVQAPDTGEAAKYALASIWAPANFIAGEIIEIGRSPCVLTVGAGTEQGVRQGIGCTVVSASGQPLDSCVVEEVFPRLSKVKPTNPRCNIQASSKVQIQAAQ